jgi:hypothetical protein
LSQNGLSQNGLSQNGLSQNGYGEMLRVLEKKLEQNGTNEGIFERSWMAWPSFDLQSLKAFHHISMCFISFHIQGEVSFLPAGIRTRKHFIELN